jgi:hypothetical protein
MGRLAGARELRPWGQRRAATSARCWLMVSMCLCSLSVVAKSSAVASWAWRAARQSWTCSRQSQQLGRLGAGEFEGAGEPVDDAQQVAHLVEGESSGFLLLMTCRRCTSVSV